MRVGLMFFFIGGIGPRTVTLEKQARTCPNCGRPVLSLKRTDLYLSLFFIPLFPVKRGEPFLSCEACGAVFDASGEPQARAGPYVERTRCRCGHPVESDFRYCPHCGSRLDLEMKMGSAR